MIDHDGAQDNNGAIFRPIGDVAGRNGRGETPHRGFARPAAPRVDLGRGAKVG
jgi:hypothetical protein